MRFLVCLPDTWHKIGVHMFQSPLDGTVWTVGGTGGEAEGERVWIALLWQDSSGRYARGRRTRK